ncbi:type II secretion system F family protein [Candidatus Methanosphaera massiliense]|jgi:Flp pilus assembly protein TadB|uniref:type II secretion system F family protein n=1 Tax=Methanosphaera TaxID=2316 RepID=UPI00237FE119|nr:type II secretion system F family protein [Candidatus Methanosphaera massiliense]MDD6286294.1 type II secretion system F family protein [Methanobacteriaceae archaeon]MDE4077541.1 type II secretion system F family protein [Candidatus Methanosphaera massiliense]MDY2745302.1 type II secretion system F family protein [Methanosphaera sp.]
MYEKLITYLSDFIKTTIKPEKLNKMQSALLQIDWYVKIEDLISMIIIMTIGIFFVTYIISLIFNITKFSLIFSLVPSIFIINYVIYKNEQRITKIEEELPDYLYQLSSLLKVGLGLETALNELSITNKGPLNNEIKRALVETKFGKPFNDALLSIGERNNIDNLKYTFQIIIKSKETGGNLANILESIAADLNDKIMLKKQRRASVMMSVMFLLISSIIATPFALGMIRLYSEFLEQIGRNNPLTTVIPTASIGYMLIHSILVSILLGIIMYSDMKKGVKYLLLIIPSSLAVYYISQLIFKNILGIGGI